MEPFVRHIVAGGLALLGGLWATALGPQTIGVRALSGGLAAIGILLIGYGIASQLRL